MQWIADNWVAIGVIVSGALAIASVVTSWTKTTKDDEVLEAVRAVLVQVGLLAEDDGAELDVDEAVNLFAESIIENGGFDYDGIDYVVSQDGDDYEEIPLEDEEVEL